VALALALASLLAVFLFLAGAFNDTAIETYGWPQVISVAGLTLIWRNAPDGERAGMRRLVQPLESLGGSGTAARRATRLRFAGSAVLLAIGLGWLLSLHGGTQLLAPLGGFLLVAAALVLLLGPWWLRIARDLVLERQGRARAEERADIAAHMHDSVLQTLALIQRQAEQPREVRRLARGQERELRTWLYGPTGYGQVGSPPGAAGTPAASTVAEAITSAAAEVEDTYAIAVHPVVVGDCALDESLAALVQASREAMVNAAKHAEVGEVSLYAEVEPDTVHVFVRDRGVGFDPAAVPDDRHGLVDSVHGRMGRHGGAASLRSSPGEGTEVHLEMPRGRVPELARAGDARNTENRNTENRNTENRNTENRNTENRNTEVRGTELRGTDSRGTEERATQRTELRAEQRTEQRASKERHD